MKRSHRFLGFVLLTCVAFDSLGSLAQDAVPSLSGNPPGAKPIDPIASSGPSESRIAGTYEEVMRQASALTHEISQLKSGSEQHTAMKQALSDLLGKAFDLRQSIQRDKVKAARAELDLVAKRIDERDEFRAAIIRRKLEDLLAGQSLRWPTGSNANSSKRVVNDRIKAGDVVACYIDGILPMSSPGQGPIAPPVSRLDSGQLVTGFPIAVASDGTIALPLVEPIHVEGLTIREAERKVASTYISKDILRPEKARPMMTLVPRANAKGSSLRLPELTTGR